MMLRTEQIVTAQNGRVQAAGSSRTCAACIDTRGSLRIASQVIARPWPAVLEDSGALLPLASQSGVDAIGEQIVTMSAEIQAGQGAAHLGLRTEQCRGHAITDPMPRASSTSANAASTDSSWSYSRAGSSETRWSRRCRADSTMARR